MEATETEAGAAKAIGKDDETIHVAEEGPKAENVTLETTESQIKV